MEIDVAAKTAGRIKEILVDEGDFVTAGQLLARMDTAVLEAQLREAKAQLQRARIGVETAQSQVVQRRSEKTAAQAVVVQREAELDAAQRRLARTEVLAPQGTLPLQTLDDDRAHFQGAQAAVSAAQAQLATSESAIGFAKSQVIAARSDVEAAIATIQRIQADIDDSALRSPRAGRVQYRVAQPGEVLSAGGVVLNLIDLGDVYMTFFLSTKASGRVALGARCALCLTPPHNSWSQRKSRSSQMSPSSRPRRWKRRKSARNWCSASRRGLTRPFSSGICSKSRPACPAWPTCGWTQRPSGRRSFRSGCRSDSPCGERPAGCVSSSARARLRDVTLRYRKARALAEISVDIPAGRMVGVIGPDGVGKSSLLALVAGARAIQTGEVGVLGGDMAVARHRREVCPRIAYMPQGLGRNLYPTLSVFENIDFFGRLFGHDGGVRARRIEALLQATGLAPFIDRAVGKLSGGMKQKLGLCCALIHDPDLLILDEPTTGVDPLSRRQFWALIERIRAEHPGMSVLVATAYMEEAARFDWLVALDAGRVLRPARPRGCSGTPEPALWRRPSLPCCQRTSAETTDRWRYRRARPRPTTRLLSKRGT